MDHREDDGGLGAQPSADIPVPDRGDDPKSPIQHSGRGEMTDRRRNTLPCRVWRATVGRLKPLIRHLDGRGFWAWWTAVGVIPRWQLLLVYTLIVTAGTVGNLSLSRASDANCRRIHRIVIAGDAILRNSNVTAERLAQWRSADCPPR